MWLKALVLAFVLGSASTASAYTLTWVDNSTDEDSFIIERAPSATGAFTQIAVVGQNVLTYVDAGGQPGNCYRVAAANSWGMSGYSNVACAGFPPAAPSGTKVTP